MKVVWTLAARNDLDQIQEYYVERSPRAAERIWLRIHDRIGLQADFPFAAPLHRDGPARRLVISGTPYIVFYVVVGNELRVEQVLHAARDA